MRRLLALRYLAALMIEVLKIHEHRAKVARMNGLYQAEPPGTR